MSQKTTTEFEIEVSGGRITEAYVMPNGKCKMVIEVAATTVDATCHLQKGIFKLVPVSQLSLEDVWMKYQPNTKAEWNFKNRIETAIKSGLKDFWRPVCDPSFDGNGRICYEPGKKPAVGKPYNWWAKTAKEFKPEQGSRLGTKNEYISFLAVIIKELVDSGKAVEWAWNAVCNDSRELGHYRNSKDAQYAFEDTGSREICDFFDLANTCKILAEDEEAGGFCLAGGCYFNFSRDFPLADLYHCGNRYGVNNFSCGWLVLEAGSTEH